MPIRVNAAALVAAYEEIIPSRDAGLGLMKALEHFAENGWLLAPSGAGSEHAAVKRKASEESRDAARTLLKVWGAAILSPTGAICVNPEGDPDEQIKVSSERATAVLFDALNRLSETGWLVETDISLDRFVIREDYKVIRARTKTTKAALEELVQIYPRSIRELERITRGVKVPGVKPGKRKL